MKVLVNSCISERVKDKERERLWHSKGDARMRCWLPMALVSELGINIEKL